jgi:hypothetical protein
LRERFGPLTTGEPDEGPEASLPEEEGLSKANRLRVAGGYAPLEELQNHAPTIRPLNLLPPLRWSTAAIWAVVFTPLIGVLAGAAVALLVGIGPSALPWIFAAALLPTLWLIAAVLRDRQALVSFGYNPVPSGWWLLLGPLAYVIARTVRVKRASGRGLAPLFVLLLNGALIVAGSVVVQLGL